MLRSLEKRLVSLVCMVLLVFSFVAGGLAFLHGYKSSLKNAAAHQFQIVQTVLAQAEVAAFARNTEIAEGVLNGLLANPLIQACKIDAGNDLKVQRTREGELAKHLETTSYPLHSPFNRELQIGSLVVESNLDRIGALARDAALGQTLTLIIHVVIVAGLLVFFIRRLISQPILKIAREVAAIKPGSGARLKVPPSHNQDEIGQLVRNTNDLIYAAESALAEVHALATQDTLTNLPNRRHFLNRLRDEFDRLQRIDEPASVIMLDLDHFKRINDTYGHAAGDAVLVHFAELVREGIRKIDIPGRLGGEEFAIFMPVTEIREAKIFAERLRRKLENDAAIYEGKPIQVTASIGIAALLAQDKLPEDALSRADEALYKAKRNGRNRVETDPDEI